MDQVTVNNTTVEEEEYSVREDLEAMRQLSGFMLAAYELRDADRGPAPGQYRFTEAAHEWNNVQSMMEEFQQRAERVRAYAASQFEQYMAKLDA